MATETTEAATKRVRGKGRKTAAKVLPIIVDALNGLEPEEIRRALSAAAIMTGVANFEKKE